MRKSVCAAGVWRVPKKRTYIDANILIAAWRGDPTASQSAIDVLDDPTRALLTSDALWLEIMPKSVFHQKEDEQDFYRSVFERAADHSPWNLVALNCAKDMACRYGLSAMDAIHIATAINARADEFVSGEKPSKPMFRVREISVISLQIGIP